MGMGVVEWVRRLCKSLSSAGDLYGIRFLEGSGRLKGNMEGWRLYSRLGWLFGRLGGGTVEAEHSQGALWHTI